jgi:phosphate transport system substrate-binding protein
MSGQTNQGGPPTEQLSTPTRRRGSTVTMGAAVAIAVVLLVVGIATGYVVGYYTHPSTKTAAKPLLTETGSSLLYPLFTSWAGNYTAATVSAASTGSGTGQSYAETGLVNIGASDAYLKNASQTNLINLPVAISAQLIYYHLPGVTAHLNLNGTVLGMIYNGTITTWDNPLILAAQPTAVQTELKALSTETIYPIKRSDSSGDTFIFTSYCDMSWSQWSFGYSTSALTGDTFATGYDGNTGVVTAIYDTTNSIGYVGISYEKSAAADGLQYAALGDNLSLNASGGINPANYILPSAQNISYDANLGLLRLNYASYGLAVSLIMGGSWAGAITLNTGGGGTNPTATSPTPYPIVNLEYTLIKLAPSGTTVTPTNLAATVAFLEWAISVGNWAPGAVQSTYITGVNFIPLTPAVTGYDMQELASVTT